MRAYRVSILAVVLVASALAAAEPPIRIPEAVIVPQPLPPAPAPVPGGAVSLTVEQLYVVESDTPLAIRAFPRGLIAFEKSEPGVYFGRFAGGSGKWEKRQVKGPHVYVGTAVGTGRAELVLVPIGLTDEKQIVEARVDCLVGPLPPPVPPKPKPDGALGLIKASREGMAKVADSADKATEVAALAKAQRSLASAIAAGGLTKPNDILAAWRDANNAAVPGQRWAAWGKTVSDSLAALYGASKLPDGKAWAAAFTEIAEGLEQ